MNGNLKVIDGGIFTTIQDEGRLGFRKFGIPQSGAMDRQALHYANFLAGNPLGNPVLEFTMKGGKYLFESEATIAVTGANMDFKINNSPRPMYQSHKVHEGDILELTFAKEGVRAYLALHGCLRVPKTMNSFSTYTLAGIGGFEGRALQKGDTISWESKRVASNFFRKAPEHLVPRYSKTQGEKIIRILEGPESHWLKTGKAQGIESITYEVLPESDRMGIKLTGKSLPPLQTNIQSSATLPGTIQFPEAASPIVLMQDGQTTGGYPRIGKVIDADLATMAQLRPGEKMRFRKVSIAEARKLWQYHLDVMDALQKGVIS